MFLGGFLGCPSRDVKKGEELRGRGNQREREREREGKKISTLIGWRPFPPLAFLRRQSVVGHSSSN